MECVTLDAGFEAPPGHRTAVCQGSLTFIDTIKSKLISQTWLYVRLRHKEKNGVFIFVHNKEQMIFPKFDGIYGSAYLSRTELTQRTYAQTFSISRTHWKTLSNENKVCDEDLDTEANLTSCYTRYLEDTIGCSMGMLGRNEEVPW